MRPVDKFVEIAWAETDADTAAAVSDRLFELFAGDGLISAAFETDAASGRWRVEFAVPEGLTLAAIEAALGGTPGFAVERVARDDWLQAAAPDFAPVRAGRFLVHDPAHAPGPCGGIAIEIAAAQAFGTGHHATTAGCLIALDELLKKRRFRTPLDLGTGSGVLAIAAAKALRVAVLATDIDPVATRTARENAALNEVTPLMRCLTCAGLEHPDFKTGRRYDLVMANILAGPLLALARPIGAIAAPGAALILSGLLEAQVARIVSRYAAAGFVLENRLQIDEWATLTFARAAHPGRKEAISPVKPAGRS